MKRILNAQGKPIMAATTATASAVVFVSSDGESWDPVQAYNVPEWVKSPDVMNDMLSGFAVSEDECAPYYKAKRVESIPREIQ